jgi:hypothetical protein
MRQTFTKLAVSIPVKNAFIQFYKFRNVLINLICVPQINSFFLFVFQQNLSISGVRDSLNSMASTAMQRFNFIGDIVDSEEESGSEEGWIRWFCSQPGHEFLCEVLILRVAYIWRRTKIFTFTFLTRLISII